MTFNNPTARTVLDAFVVKVSADGSRLVWAGFLGSEGNDQRYPVDLDADGHLYVTGRVESGEATFPVVAGPARRTTARRIPTIRPQCAVTPSSAA